MTSLKRILVLLAMGVSSALAAQSGGPYDLSWSKVAGGGVTFEAGGAFSLGCTSGQPDAGTLSAGNFTLNGGFWGALAPGCGAVPPVLTSPISVAVGSTGNAASVPSAGGAVYAWTLTGGTITSGQGTSQIFFDAGPPGTTMQLSVTETVGACVLGPAAAAVQVDFLDVPPAHIFHDFVVKLARNGVTAGCGGGNYCPGDNVTRAQMAVFLLKGEHGSSFAPPPCAGLFPDVECTPIPAFAVNWIEQLFNEGITGGCGSGFFCPANPVTRAQMAVFLLKGEHGSGYAPPACAGVFADVACTPIPAFAVDWIERLYSEGITGGCSTNPLRYCPGGPATRGQMAVFLVKTFNLP